MERLPLEGIRVLDLTAIIGVPYGTMMLAAMGAEVIRVESTKWFPSTTRGYQARPRKELVATMGPVARGYPELDPGDRPWNRFALFNCHAINKLSMTVDLRQAEGRETFESLVAVSDVVVENLTGSVQRMGLAYERLRQVRPDIIMLSVSSMGSYGPYKDLRGFGSVAEDVMGHPWLRGYPEDHPHSVTNSVPSDPAAGTTMAWAALAALHYRDRTGKGQSIDIAMAETFMHHLGSAFLDYAMNGRVQRTTGNRHLWMAPHGCYPCKGEDRWITISVGTGLEWRALQRSMGNPAWVKDSRFADGYRRTRHQDELDRNIAAWTGQFEARELQERLQQAGVAAGMIMSVADIFVDPHMRERGFYERITHPAAGTHDYPFRIWQMSDTPFQVRQTPPLLGEHNEYVYRTLLAVDEARYRALEAGGHIGMDYDKSIA